MLSEACRAFTICLKVIPGKRKKDKCSLNIKGKAFILKCFTTKRFVGI